MTTEEAIKILRREIECLSHTKCEDCILEAACDPIKTTPYDSEYIEVYEMAISALEKNESAEEWYKVFCEKLDSAENKGEWIPVSERLPKIADVYRVTRYYPNNVMNPNYLVDACFFDGSNTWYNDNRINHERAYADNVIAWQENPEPYKAESEEEWTLTKVFNTADFS